MALPPPHPVSKWLVTTDWLNASLGTPGLVIDESDGSLDGGHVHRRRLGRSIRHGPIGIGERQRDPQH